jgi:multiple sugar transport system ATP-binding protein
MASIELDHVTKVYPGGVPAVNDLSLDIPDGDFMVFVGPSGSGKSTALRMVAGLEDLTKGTIRIGDRVVNDLPPRDRDIAMVFQNYALYPHMTVAENLAFGLQLHKTPKGRAAPPGRRGGQDADVGTVPESQARGAVGGAAPAGRHGPRDRP